MVTVSTNSSEPAGDLSHRKTRHLEICTEPEYEPEGGSAGWEHLQFRHRALPELNWGELNTQTSFLGRAVKLPLFISSMTGGSDSSYSVNKDLARAAQAAGIPVGMGSIRILFRKPEAFADFHLRPLARDVPIFANLGAQQLVEEKARDGYRTLGEWLKRLEVDATAVHLNPGQELYQDDGDRNFRGLKTALTDFIEHSHLPVIVKETGFGIAPDEVDFLLSAGATYVDLAGAGGTNWLTVEAYRLDAAGYQSSEGFRDWGWPTALLTAAVASGKGSEHRQGRILASGGLRNGLDVAKALALGAHAAGMALPFVRAIKDAPPGGGCDAVLALIAGLERALKTAMLLSGSADVSGLRKARLDATSEFEHRLQQVRD